MSNILRPVGSQPTRVYWVRRMVLLLAVFLALGAVFGAVNKFTSGSADASDGGKESAASAKKAAGGAKAKGGKDAKSTEPKENDGTPEECTDADLGLELAVNKTSFGPDQKPEFSYALTNAGTAPCLIDVNDVTRTVEVTSGNDPIFSSGFCVKEKPRLLLLKEDEVDAGKLSWDRVRNDAKCSKDLPSANPGTYHATAQIKGTISDEVVFTLD